MIRSKSPSTLGTADENYQGLTRFMAQAKHRLRPGGRILLNFGTSGDIDYLGDVLGHVPDDVARVPPRPAPVGVWQGVLVPGVEQRWGRRTRALACPLGIGQLPRYQS